MTDRNDEKTPGDELREGLTHLFAAARKAALAAETSLVPSQEGTDVALWAPSAADSNKSALRRLAEGIASRTTQIAARLTKSAMRFLGVPYVFGGTSISGFDCSGYVQHVFAMLGVHLPRTADAQYEVGKKVAHLESGDLVFFQTYTYGASHVGIYLGHGRFVHSSSSHGVEVSELHDAYWSRVGFDEGAELFAACRGGSRPT